MGAKNSPTEKQYFTIHGSKTYENKSRQLKGRDQYIGPK